MPRALYSTIAGWFVVTSWISAACGDLPVDSAAGAVSGSGGGDSGSLSCAGQGRWSPISDAGMPEGRVSFVAAWTGTEMLIWGGIKSVALDIDGVVPNGWRYHLGTDAWQPMSSAGAPAGFVNGTGIWTGDRFIVYGGSAGGNDIDPAVQGGAAYDPVADAWTPLPSAGAPPNRGGHTAVWTGSRMILWGGWIQSKFLNDGAQYDPAMDAWFPMTTISAPENRVSHTAVWTGSRMIVWGGTADGPKYLASGGVYDPATDTWAATSMVNAPAARRDHVAVWTGSRMIIWGGDREGGGMAHDDGAIYDPASDTWSVLPAEGGPGFLYPLTGVWTGKEMILWGNTGYPERAGRGALYDPKSGKWADLSSCDAPPWHLCPAVWTGTQMILWGGNGAKVWGGIFTL